MEEVEKYFLGFIAFIELYRTGNTKTKEQVKKKTILPRKEKETHC